MEDLTKTQIVLLTLLVSFVTSIATGIVTVALVDQAPASIPQTIQRVVERTVEKITPVINNKPGAVSKETTVVVKEDDLITASIEKNGQSLVRLRRENDASGIEGEGTTTTFVGLGVLLPGDVIATDPSLLSASGNYTALFANGATAVLKRLETPKGAATALFSFASLEETSSTTHAFLAPRPVTFADTSALKLGQSVISLSGRERNAVAIGILSSLEYGAPKSGKGEKKAGTEQKTPTGVLAALATTISPGDISPGNPLVNIFGELVGLSVKDGSSGMVFIPGNFIADELAAVASKTTAPATAGTPAQ